MLRQGSLPSPNHHWHSDRSEMRTQKGKRRVQGRRRHDDKGCKRETEIAKLRKLHKRTN